MEIGHFQKKLSKYKKATFDTMVLIYFIERHEQYVPLIREIFSKAVSGDMNYHLSVVSYMEVMTGFYKMQDAMETEKARSFFKNYPAIHYETITKDIADKGARLRAEYGFKTPDALILATALAYSVEVFITNDTSFKTFTQLPILYLGDYV